MTEANTTKDRDAPLDLEPDTDLTPLRRGLILGCVVLATRSILWTIVVGMGLFTALRLWL